MSGLGKTWKSFFTALLEFLGLITIKLFFKTLWLLLKLFYPLANRIPLIWSCSIIKVLNTLRLNMCLDYTSCWSTCLILAELSWMLQGVPSITEGHSSLLHLALYPLLLSRGPRILETLKWHSMPKFQQEVFKSRLDGASRNLV